ncbi:hypothetical protein A2761_03245 [Candidatus Kaiserbacteria bacterium RIFCSPHIGHO2_01_FULL_51_33]|nr:MAG: hypothetical protein A2761_03245 [Candidatus Kaiserbacteria bacterium RIFCSPHIGHO2_01_FULL_51_33]
MKSLNIPWLVSIAFLIVFTVLVGIAQIVNAANSNSADFESNNQEYLSISDANQNGLDITGPLTLEAWIKLESLPITDESYNIISKYDGTGGGNSYKLDLLDTGGQTGLGLQTNDTCEAPADFELARSYNFSTGTWYHVAATYDSNFVAEFFVNGTSIGTTTGPATAFVNCTGTFRIGAFLNTVNIIRYFDGLIDDVRVWNIARSASAIASDYQTELTGSEFGLVGYWKLNESSDGSGAVTRLDATANNNDLGDNNTVLSSTNVPFGAPLTPVLKVRKAANENATTDIILDDDNSLFLTLAANMTYIIDGTVLASSTSATPDIHFSFNSPSDAVMDISYTTIHAGTNEPSGLFNGNNQDSGKIDIPANGTPDIIRVSGTVQMGATDGNLKFRWAQMTSNATPTTVLRGSYLRAEAI